jgi:hypothetical protein
MPTSPDLPDGADAVALRFREPKRQLKPPLAFIDMVATLPPIAVVKSPCTSATLMPEAGNLLPIDVDGEIGLTSDLLDFNIFHPLICCSNAAISCLVVEPSRSSRTA